MGPFVVDRRHYAREPGGLASARTLAAFNRVNALACILSAGRGWIGASYSACELLTTLAFALGEARIVLSKGHAAVMQYACLYGLGRIDRAALLSYEDGPGALQAHTDRVTPGILLDTGSLGQALSKTAGLALYHPGRRHAVVLGDGELQEGQVFEALQTLAHRGLAQVTPIVDLNGFQTEQPVAEVKRIADPRRLFEGLGLRVLDIDGHDPGAIAGAWREAAGAPTVILARTVKAGGTALLAPVGGRQPWHGRVPDADLARAIVEEQLDKAGRPDVSAEFSAWLRDAPPAAPPPPARASDVASTRDGFARRLATLAREREDVVVLSADLAHACGLDPLAGHPRLVEMGISEQDLVSFAGGLALDGRLPIVCTYAAFLRRAYEQMLVNASDGPKIIYAGHYAGLCYHTDGKTHQSLNDLAFALTVPGLVVVDPATPAEAARWLDWAAGPQPASVYLRLRRTPIPLALPDDPAAPVGRPTCVGEGFRRCFITAGTVPTRLALDCLADPGFAGWGLLVQSVLRGPIDRAFLAERLAGVDTIVTIEDDLSPGSLAALVGRLVAELGLRPRLIGHAIERPTASFRTLEACLAHHGFTVAAIRAKI